MARAHLDLYGRLPGARRRPAPARGAPPAQFYTPATASLQERRPQTWRHGDTFAVPDPNGDAISDLRSPEGLFHRDTRGLSHVAIRLAADFADLFEVRGARRPARGRMEDPVARATS